MTRGVPAIHRIEGGRCAVEWSREGGLMEAGLGCPAGGVTQCWVSGSSLSLVASAHCDRRAVQPFFLSPEEATTSWCLQSILLYPYFSEWQRWLPEGGEGEECGVDYGSVLGGWEPWVRHANV